MQNWKLKPTLEAFIMLSLYACSNNAQSDSPPKAVIAGPAAITERETAPLNGQASIAGSGSIVTYSWTVTKPEGANVSISDASAPLTTLVVGEIGQNLSITITLTVINSNGQSSSSQQDIQVTDVDFAKLPLKPGAAESMASTLGIDADTDGVRDDVEHSIYSLYPVDTARRQVLLIGAKALQMQVMAGSSGAVATGDAASEQSALFARCIYSLDPAKAEGDYATVLAFTINTDERERAYRAYQQSRAGTIQRSINRTDANCRFDS